jgi:hypothetical protein
MLVTVVPSLFRGTQESRTIITARTASPLYEMDILIILVVKVD